MTLVTFYMENRIIKKVIFYSIVLMTDYLHARKSCGHGHFNSPNECVKVKIPKNGKLNILGNNWACQEGFFKSGNACKKVAIPKNGKLNILGNNWACQEGFFKSGNACKKVAMPKNGKLNILGNNWACQEGFFKSGNACKKVAIPKNGKLNILGNNWTCQEGFFKSGNVCTKVAIPKNGKLNILGNDWDCKEGYKKVRAGCRKMTAAEKETFEKQRQLFLRRMKTNYSSSLHSNVNISSKSFSCSKDILNGGYDSCSLSFYLNVDLSNTDLNLDIEYKCRAEVEYSYVDKDDIGKSGYVYKRTDNVSEEESVTVNVSLGSGYESVSMNFDVSKYSYITTSAELQSLECEKE